MKDLSILNFSRHPASDLSQMLRTTLPAFPGLQSLHLYGMTGVPIALPPLTALSGLKKVHLSQLRPEPAPTLPPHIKLTLHPRPRA